MNNFNSSEKEIWVTCRYNSEIFSEYQVSNLGKVKSFKGKTPRILKLRKTRNGYLQVCLCKDNRKKSCNVHRLVLSSFSELPENWQEMQVNHIDQNPQNNCLSNLNWLTPKENCNWGDHNERISKAMRNNSKISKAVFQFTLAGEFIKEWQSTNEIERQLGFSRGNISKCCLGKRKTAYNCVWRYSPNFEL